MGDGNGESIKGLRITVLGPAASGKTCLINAYVNNTCPNVYTPTDDPTLYYRTLRAEINDELITVLLEIEDTYSSDRTDGKDHFARNRNIANFIALKKTTGVATGAKGAGPFASAPTPKESAYEPFSKGRMAFLILFDINDANSFASAQEVFRALNERHKSKVGSDIEPIVYLVANKIDQDPHGEEPALLRRRAQAWENHPDHELRFRFMDVSALEFTRVRKLFRSIAEEILEKPALWATDADSGSGLAAVESASWGGLFGGGSGNAGGGGGMLSGWGW